MLPVNHLKISNGICIPQLLQEVVGIKHGSLAHLCQALRTQGTDIGKGTHHYAEVPIEGPHAAYALGAIVVEGIAASSLVPHHHWDG